MTPELDWAVNHCGCGHWKSYTEQGRKFHTGHLRQKGAAARKQLVPSGIPPRSRSPMPVHGSNRHSPKPEGRYCCSPIPIVRARREPMRTTTASYNVSCPRSRIYPHSTDFIVSTSKKGLTHRNNCLRVCEHAYRSNCLR